MNPTKASLAAFQRDGYLSGIPIADGPRAAHIRRQFDALEARVGRETAEIGLSGRHFEESFIWEMATDPTILDWVESLIGPNILLLSTHFFCKYGGAVHQEKFVAWHQDVTFWGLEPPQAITAWYAVDDADLENGCMRVIPGTHQGGIAEHGKAQQAGNLLSVNQEIAVAPEDEQRAVDLVLSAGQMSLHDGSIVHGSLPNRSARRRCGLTIRYVPSHVREVGIDGRKHGWKAILVRGVDREQNFEALEPPDFG